MSEKHPKRAFVFPELQVTKLDVIDVVTASWPGGREPVTNNDNNNNNYWTEDLPA